MLEFEFANMRKTLIRLSKFVYLRISWTALDKICVIIRVKGGLGFWQSFGSGSAWDWWDGDFCEILSIEVLTMRKYPGYGVSVFFWRKQRFHFNQNIHPPTQSKKSWIQQNGPLPADWCWLVSMVNVLHNIFITKVSCHPGSGGCSHAFYQHEKTLHPKRRHFNSWKELDKCVPYHLVWCGGTYKISISVTINTFYCHTKGRFWHFAKFQLSSYRIP